MNLISKQDSKLKAEDCQLGCPHPQARHALVALRRSRLLPSSAFFDGQVIRTPPCVPHLGKRLLTLR